MASRRAFPKALPEWSVWLATVIFAFWLAFAILSVAGTWRRVVLWITALVLIAGWAPVLSLAARSPDIGAPFIAVAVVRRVRLGLRRKPPHGLRRGQGTRRRNPY